MAALSCAEARDLACDLLDGELTAEMARLLEEHVAGCPTCPGLYRALVAVHRELTRLRREAQAADGSDRA
jgi:RNA polymerase sigma-70 factor, ECF subfamily